MIVFLKTSEEAVCDESTVCNYIFEGTNIPIVSDATLAFDAGSQQYPGKYLFTLNGSNLDMTGPDLHI